MIAGAMVLVAADLFLFLPFRRQYPRLTEGDGYSVSGLTVVLTAYNDEESIGLAVKDFLEIPLVKRVIVVSNHSTDRTFERAQAAGAMVFDEAQPGYGRCVFRCLSEGAAFEDTECVVLCEGDMTFRARDLAKMLAYIPHAEVVNGTRIVEQLRAYSTQLTTFMYYGNFYVGKLLEAKHFGKGTFTDVGTTYKMLRRDTLLKLLPKLNAGINLEFNAHFLDIALTNNVLLLECPITFHARVGKSKGGNVNDFRAVKVGLRMILGLMFGWKKASSE
jgi:glycosyltransferase involved in cell wall biosynthesis